MARYIDADAFAERIMASPIFPNMGQDGYFLREFVLGLICRQATADVVPRAEVERLQHILDCYALQYGTVKDQQSVIDKAKAETKREIGEEIHRIIGECHNETWVCLLMKEFADKLVKGGDTDD